MNDGKDDDTGFGWRSGRALAYQKEASQFVNELFFLIQKSLDEDKIVKVKGLGTFKIIDVDDRESVDVNTGDRVLIEGHGKITFTPDALMKELVNKPFSQFETVVLNEGVDFNEATASEPEEPSTIVVDETEDSAAPLVEFVDEHQPEVVETPVAVEPTKAVEPLMEKTIEKSEETDAPEEKNASEEKDASDEQDVPDEPEAPEEESGFKKYLKWIGIAVLTLAVGILIGYLIVNHSKKNEFI